MSLARILTIAGSDSGGGAGIEADLKTIERLGGYGMAAVTAVTAQNTQGLFGVWPLPPEAVQRQIEVVVEDIGVDAIKSGMLGSAATVRAVAATLRRCGAIPFVLDPVMVAKGGDRLLAGCGRSRLQRGAGGRSGRRISQMGWFSAPRARWRACRAPVLGLYLSATAGSANRVRKRTRL